MKTDLVSREASIAEAPVKTVHYRKRGAYGATGRVSVRTLREMIARWELGPDDLIRVEGDPVERRIREYPALAPLDEMLRSASEKVLAVRRGKGKRAGAIRELELLREYAEQNDRIYAVAAFLLGWLRYAENPALSRGLFLKSIERGYPVTAVARNNLAIAQIRMGDPAGRDNLILAANDPQRTPAALQNLARLLQHLQMLGESTEEIANVKDLLRVARAEWRKAPPAHGEPSSYALFLCDGDIPETFASESRAVARIQGQIEDILVEGEDCLRQGRLEQAMAHAARASAEMDRARDELSKGTLLKGISPLRFLSVRLARLEKTAAEAREAREKEQQLDAFRRRLRSLEESLLQKVPPADILQQAEILLDSARTEVERGEAGNILRECRNRVAGHLLETAGELLATGEKDVALGLLRRASALESRFSDEIKLRIAGVRRDDLEKEISICLEGGHFEEARVKIARLRSMHPIFEPAARRLEGQVNAIEAGALLDRVVAICSGAPMEPARLSEARRLLEMARVLHPEPAFIKPVEDHLTSLGARKPDAGAASPAANRDARRP